MFDILVSLIVHTPVYPHWLEFRNKRRGNSELIPLFSGRVLETGCGNAEMKEQILRENKRVTTYLATDYTSWDSNFQQQKKLIHSLGPISRILYGAPKDPAKLDAVCDAMDLHQYKNGSFDTYCSFEVLEHISDPVKFFQEANRVLKKSGLCIITTPFLYREHGGMDFDFQRFTRGGYYELAKKTGFTIEKLYTHGYFGTMMAALTNQFMIRKIMEDNWLVKVVLFPLAPFVFFFTNTLGYIIEIFDRDVRFAPYYHVVMKKTK